MADDGDRGVGRGGVRPLRLGAKETDIPGAACGVVGERAGIRIRNDLHAHVEATRELTAEIDRHTGGLPGLLIGASEQKVGHVHAHAQCSVGRKLGPCGRVRLFHAGSS